MNPKPIRLLTFALFFLIYQVSYSQSQSETKKPDNPDWNRLLNNLVTLEKLANDSVNPNDQLEAQKEIIVWDMLWRFANPLMNESRRKDLFNEILSKESIGNHPSLNSVLKRTKQLIERQKKEGKFKFSDRDLRDLFIKEREKAFKKIHDSGFVSVLYRQMIEYDEKNECRKKMKRLLEAYNDIISVKTFADTQKLKEHNEELLKECQDEVDKKRP